MRTFFILILTLIALPVLAQSGGVEMADAMVKSGKIYIVIGVLSIIFVGIVVYLVMLDRRVGKMERELNESIKN